ncbi:uncharacterized protein M421DRAFT_416565 [Didymella exigua CBS 183.55]|uniref:Uncharacterized protein n=1 Tax=Didymella exigua CBS 183.55 TaxID=1150837 RepID=A0A6A5S639_9PLEO|nr:uncharacterized protein M421DRAFT_416565 [Didymella exigua CBS 183.55]KAF1932967.1 hypothetical protein M421DRAFT_416565 [Didymella exigua CBS 183.55]
MNAATRCCPDRGLHARDWRVPGCLPAYPSPRLPATAYSHGTPQSGQPFNLWLLNEFGHRCPAYPSLGRPPRKSLSLSPATDSATAEMSNPTISRDYWTLSMRVDATMTAVATLGSLRHVAVPHPKLPAITKSPQIKSALWTRCPECDIRSTARRSRTKSSR